MPLPVFVARCLWMLGIAATLSACSPSTGQQESAGPAQQLDALVEQYFEDILPLEPFLGTYLGDPRYNDRLPNDIAPGTRQRRRELHQRYLDAAEAIPADSLSPADQLTRAVFLRERRTDIERLGYPQHLLPIDQMYSVPATFALLGSGTGAQPFATVADYDAFLKRCADLPAWIDQAIANMREGMKTGVVHPRTVVEAVVRQLDELAVADPAMSVFYPPLARLPATFEPAERERIAAEYGRALSGAVLPAYRRLADFVAREYLPASRDSVAWSALPQGDAWYRLHVASATTTTLSPDEIHDIGQSEVARIRSEMERVRDSVGFSGDLAAFFEHLKSEPRFYFANAAELLAGYEELKRKIDARLPQLFATVPLADYEVREVEAFRAQSAAGASYQPPAPDGSRPGIFYVNTFNLKAQPRFGMETLSLHEAAPGHHYQQAIQLGLEALPRFRRFGGDYVAYVEGWALYAESLGPELGLFTDPYQLYGRLSDEMLRAMRLVVDTGLHSKGWSREQAIRYMQDNSSLAESDITAEVDRYIAMPGQALGYKVGEIRIRALRSRAEAALGNRFDVRDFHDEILKDGALPIDILEAKLDRWLAAQTASAR